jgi:uncharacterized protein (DUF1501 family)
MLTRRQFIHIGAASVGSLALRPFGVLPALAQNSSSYYRALVCVFLFGGNDSNNMVIPMDDASFKAYTSIRENLALTSSTLTPTAYSTSNAPYAFHGKLPDMANLFSSKELAVVANVGSLVQPLTQIQYQNDSAPLPLNLFSHADQQLQWQSSIAQGNSPTGWGGRAADYVASQQTNSSDFPTFLSVAGNSLQGSGTSTQPVAITPGESLTLKGFNSNAISQARWNALNNLLNLESGISLAQAANNTMAHSIADAGALTSALATAPPLNTVFPTTSLGSQLKQVAQVLQVQSQLGMRRQIFFASLGGFDTHTNELSTHDTLYPQLNDALLAFYQATQEIGMADSVTTFTESDFNRTFQPTSGNGSDHAWGGHHLVLGGAVHGAQIYGQFPVFQLGGPNDADVRGRWIPTTSIDQYGATLASWFGIPDASLVKVFPNFPNFNSTKLTFLG